MSRRLPFIAAWLLAGHAAALAMFWALLQIPESSWYTLAASAMTALLALFIAAAAHSGASGGWTADTPLAQGLRLGVRRMPAALLAAAIFLLVWWATGAASDWHGRLRGQLDATVIAQTGSPATSWIHTAIAWLILFVRWSLGLTLAATLLGSLVQDGSRAALRSGWVTRGLHPRRWLPVTVWFVLLLVLPWHYVDWRPARLGLGLEPWFVAAKLTVVALLMATGTALVLREGARR